MASVLPTMADARMARRSPLRERVPSPSLAPLLLLAAWAFLFFYGLDSSELYRTEGLRAVVAAEMLRDGHWAVPTLYGEPFLTKPPGAYVAIALCSLPFGEVTEASARLP